MTSGFVSNLRRRRLRYFVDMKLARGVLLPVSNKLLPWTSKGPFWGRWTGGAQKASGTYVESWKVRHRHL